LKYIVRIIPNPDACNRCKREAYINETTVADGYKTFIVDAKDYNSTSPVHPPTCRCYLEIISVIEPEDYIESEFVSPEQEKSKLVVEKLIRESARLENQLNTVPTRKKPWSRLIEILSEFIGKTADRIFSKVKGYK